MAETIGLVGVGLVGTALAENLMAAGYCVSGYDIDDAKCRRLESLGGKAVASARAVGEDARRVFLSLMDTDIVIGAVEGPGGLLEASSPPSYLIDCSTGDPERTSALARRLKERDISLLDAPISGSSEQIRGRDGVFMIGGEKKAFEACEDLFAATAKQYFRVGDSGAGSKAKLASNLILGLNRLVLAEGLVFAERLGLDLKTFLALIKKTPAYSRAMDVKGKKLVEEDFKPQSRMSQHGKDLEIILEYANRFGQPLPLAALHKEIIEAGVRSGDGELDSCAVIRQIRRMRREEQ